MAAVYFDVGPRDSEVPREGLALWLRADRGVVTNENGRVVEWRDQSGQGRTAAAQLEEYQPLWRAAGTTTSRPVIELDTASRQLLVDNNVYVGSPCTVVLVCKQAPGAGGKVLTSRTDGNWILGPYGGDGWGGFHNVYWGWVAYVPRARAQRIPSWPRACPDAASCIWMGAM